MDVPETDARDRVVGDRDGSAAAAADAARADRDPPPAPLVDWVVTARRVGRSAVVLVVLAVLGWVVRAAVVDAWSWAHLGNWFGLAVGGIFVVELFVVGGSALRGMLRAGERGERLSSHDVGLLPPLRGRGSGDGSGAGSGAASGD